MEKLHPSRTGQRSVFVVALTGGIASGKTTVSDLFADLGVPVIDTDVIARDLVEPGQPILASIVSAFGHELLDVYGRLRRANLRKLIFNSAEKRQQLEAIIHPHIAVEARAQIKLVCAPYCILVVPLLAETSGYAGADRVLVVDTHSETQVERLRERDGVSAEQAVASLQAQVSREERLTIADDVIENSGNKADLEKKVQDLHLAYLAYCS